MGSVRSRACRLGFCMRCTPSRLASQDDQSGFTLVEMVIAIALGAIVFTALAAYMSSGLRVLAVQKARTQANEIATQAIEDLQRLDDEYLGLCSSSAFGPPATPTTISAPTGSPPPDFADTALWVSLPHCVSSGSGMSAVSEPCMAAFAAPAAPVDIVPAGQYNCRRLNITYTVRRYVAWTSTNRLAKRLAAHVTWTDSGKFHEVVQASTRSTASPPAVTGGSVDPPQPSIADDGTLGVPVTLLATTTGLTSGDAVRAFFTYLDPTDVPRAFVVSLTTSDGGTNWSAPITALKLPRGAQYVIFTAVRAEDKREGSGGVATLNPTCSTCPPGAPTVNPPVISYVPIGGGGPNIDSAGVLVSDEIRVLVTSSGISSSGTVTAMIPTNGEGVRAMPLRLGAAPCTVATNCWGAILTKEAAGSKGFRFSNNPSGGSVQVRAMGAQGTVFGSTAVSANTAVTFQ